ncbi:SulP family inorganic anion transporter [Denitromonas ohlonensis]|uniref:STAS domain-containing protein n=2 Tax=Denitromonas TaxID=139331 RepID=A0A557RC47_9RHOO|nr:SulP family inorganic anion transporter [Denitromonas ohlonensis]TVO62754.1 STAS domain-containing protein [Denitromonas ohlonensis]TVO78959.1 STAS domain-containing protein [Denitromonas ohlonensis]
MRFRPRLLDTLPGYDRAQLAGDAGAGITVGVLALPLAMAFAIASGMSPTAGIWTAIVAGLLISLLGGSRVQIGGPTGAFIPIIYAIVVDYGVANLLIATMLAGLMLIAMGAFRLGNMIRFIPISVVIGFTNGIAVVIFLSQIKDFLGLKIDQLPGEFFGKISTLAGALGTTHLPTVTLATASLALLIGWNRLAQRIRWMRRLPGPLGVLVIGTAVTALFSLPVDTIGSRFGGIPQAVPALAFPDLDLTNLGKLIAPALTIAMLGAIESLLSARVADGQIDDRHDPNQELLAQGVANLIAPLFGGFAATGAIARTATNVRSGGRTPIAGIIHSVVLLAVVLALAPLAHHIPLATLSAIVVMVSFHMGEWHAFKTLRRFSAAYRTVLLSTFFITVVFDLTLAVELGLVMASLFFIHRVSDLTRIEPVPLADGASDADRARIQVFRIFGSLFFGAANKLEALLAAADTRPAVIILNLDKVINIDTTGLEILQNLHRTLAKQGAVLILCELNTQPASLIARSGFAAQVGDANIVRSLDMALARANACLASAAPSGGLSASAPPPPDASPAP